MPDVPEKQPPIATGRKIHDQRTRYCRMLGHDLTFAYCRQTGTGLFCRKIFDCWYGKIEVVRFVKEFFSDDEIAAVLRPPAPKIHSLIGLIDKAREG